MSVDLFRPIGLAARAVSHRKPSTRRKGSFTICRRSDIASFRPYGRLVIWLTEAAPAAMSLIVNAKFDQHPGLAPILEATAERHIVVCGADDRHWRAGVSLQAYAKKIASPTARPNTTGQRYGIVGRNLLGELLEQRRRRARQQRV